MPRPFAQVDVFGRHPYEGNPVAVVLDGDGLSTEEMQRFTRWTNLSEATFVLPPTDPAADYRLRIFTSSGELPFAGHPTLGSCHAWLEQRREKDRADAGAARVIVQQCGAGLIRIHQVEGRLTFEAPPLVRSGPVDDGTLASVVEQLGITGKAVLDAAWVDNGPGWVAVLLEDAAAVRALRPAVVDRMIGAVGAYPPGSPSAIEVRAFCIGEPATFEDPVTGSLNASLAQWLLASGRLQAPYVASQGGEVGRAGRVEISREDDTILVGGATVTCVRGSVEL